MPGTYASEMRSDQALPRMKARLEVRLGQSPSRSPTAPEVIPRHQKMLLVQAQDRTGDDKSLVVGVRVP
jgi:hypothetical protein